jgi:hypothetical protein
VHTQRELCGGEVREHRGSLPGGALRAPFRLSLCAAVLAALGTHGAQGAPVQEQAPAPQKPPVAQKQQLAASTFNEEFLGIGGDQPNADLSLFSFGNRVLAGKYTVDVSLNERGVGQSEVRFEDKEGTNDAVACLTRGLLDKKTGEVVGKEEYYVEKDECNRPDTTLEGLSALPAHFDRTSGQGTVTAGNSSQLSDGASATLVMSMERAKALGIKPKLLFRGFAVAGCEPDEMGIGPVYAVPKLLGRHGLTIGDIDVWELNEAFASQVVYCRDRLGLDPEKLNINGGSISIGHPFGMTGSRMVGTLTNEMLRRKARLGVVTMCIGGGQGAAGLFEACL